MRRRTNSSSPWAITVAAPMTALLGVIVIALSGCASPESQTWAQTSPLIMPEKRPLADAITMPALPVRGVSASRVDQDALQIN